MNHQPFYALQVKTLNTFWGPWILVGHGIWLFHWGKTLSDRAEHLHVFLHVLHDMLQLQSLAYTVYVIEQIADTMFNRGMLMNIGYDIARKADPGYQCFVFHDVDLLPENATNIYRCSDSAPRHLCPAVDKFNYSLPYATLFGGVTAFTHAQFVLTNGYSNKYFNWGGEDDDMFARIKKNNFEIERPTPQVGRYKMMSHGAQQRNPFRHLLGRHNFLSGGWRRDGLRDLKYRVIARETRPLYTWALVDLHESQARNHINTAVAQLRRNLPFSFRNVSDSKLKQALLNLKDHYKGPFQLAMELA